MTLQAVSAIPPVHDTWTPLSLEAVLSGSTTGPVPEIVWRTDDEGLLYPRRIHSVAGEPGSGKSWIALAASAQVISDGGCVLYIDFEDSAEGTVQRLRLLGLTDEQIRNQFGYISPQEPRSNQPNPHLNKWISTARLIVLDGVTNSMQLEGLNPLDNADTAEWMRKVVLPFAAAESPAAVLLIDHVAKNRSNQNSPVGAQHKLAAVQVQYRVRTVRPLDPEHDGVIGLEIIKDRYGQVQRLSKSGRGGAVAYLDLRNHEVGGQPRIEARFVPPTSSTIVTSRDLTTAIEDFLQENPNANRTEIRAKVRGRESDVVAALDRCVADGTVSEHRHGRIRRYTVNDTAAPVVPPRP